MDKPKRTGLAATAVVISYSVVALSNNGVQAVEDPMCGFEYPDCSKHSDAIMFATSSAWTDFGPVGAADASARSADFDVWYPFVRDQQHTPR